MLKQLLMHGQCRDIPFNRAPPDMWSEVNGAKPGDGCMIPHHSLAVMFDTTLAACYPWHLQAGAINVGAGAWQDAFILGLTNTATITSVPVTIRLIDDQGNALLANISPAEWAAGIYYQLAVSNAWTGGIFNGWAVMNVPGLINNAAANAGLYPCAYDLTTTPSPATAVGLPGWNQGIGTGWRTYAMRPFRDFLVAMQKWVGGNARYESTVFWSDAAGAGLPGTWTPAAGNMAGDADLNDTPGPLIDGYMLGNDFIIFKPSSCIRMTYVGGAEVFTFETLSSSAGIINRNCAVEYEGRLLVFGPNDIYALSPDGSTESLMTDGVRRYLYETISGTPAPNYDHCSLRLSSAEGRLYALYSNVDSPGADYYATEAAVLDLRTGRWGNAIVQLDGGNGFNTAAAVPRRNSNTSNRMLGAPTYLWLIGNGASTDNIWCVESPQMDWTTAPDTYPASLTRLAIDFDEPQRNKTVTGIRLLVDAQNTLGNGELFTVTLTGRQLLDGAISETSGRADMGGIPDRAAGLHGAGQVFRYHHRQRVDAGLR